MDRAEAFQDYIPDAIGVVESSLSYATSARGENHAGLKFRDSQRGEQQCRKLGNRIRIKDNFSQTQEVSPTVRL